MSTMALDKVKKTPTPKTPIPKVYKHKVDIRRQKYKMYRLQGLSGYKAAIKAGFSESYATHVTTRVENSHDFNHFMVKAGLTNEKLLSKLDEGLEANRVISAVNTSKANENTHDFIDVPDHSVRHKYLETALRLKGVGRESASIAPIAININLGDTPIMQEPIDISASSTESSDALEADEDNDE